jgi:hypothetical protein
MGEVSRNRATAEALKLVLTLAAMAGTFAYLRDAHGRLHQAQAARAAAHLRGYTPPAGGHHDASSRRRLVA